MLTGSSTAWGPTGIGRRCQLAESVGPILALGKALNPELLLVWHHKRRYISPVTIHPSPLSVLSVQNTNAESAVFLLWLVFPAVVTFDRTHSQQRSAPVRFED